MELYKNTRVVFTEDPHSYTLDGVTPLIGVTSLMRKHGLSANYDGIDAATLKRAADLGSMAHQVIENYCNGLPVVETPLVKSFAKLGLNPVATEYLVSDNEVTASKVDLVVGVGEDSVELWDIKRTSSVHREALAWQLGIYKYLFERANPSVTVTACKCLPIKKGNVEDVNADKCGTPVAITPVPASEVERLLECEKSGILYGAPASSDKDEAVVAIIDGNGGMDALVQNLSELARIRAVADELDAKLAAVTAEVYDYLLSHDKDSVTVGGVSFKLKRPYERSSFDTTKFKKDHPDMAEAYTKTTVAKGSVSMKINN